MSVKWNRNFYSHFDREKDNEYVLQNKIKEKYQFCDWPFSIYLQVVQHFNQESFL